MNTSLKYFEFSLDIYRNLISMSLQRDFIDFDAYVIKIHFLSMSVTL